MKRELISMLAALGFSAAANAQTQPAQGCYVPSSGVVYVVGAAGTPANCASGHTPITLQGPAGATGAAGPAGPRGPAGGDGISGFEIVSSESAVVARGAFGSATAVCPTGKRAIGGGHSAPNHGDFTIHLVGSGPANAGAAFGNAWLVRFFNQTGAAGPITVSAYAVCAFAG